MVVSRARVCVVPRSVIGQAEAVTTQGEDTGVAQPGGGTPGTDDGVAEQEAEVTRTAGSPPSSGAGVSSGSADNDVESAAAEAGPAERPAPGARSKRPRPSPVPKEKDPFEPLREALAELRVALAAARFGLSLPSAEEAQRQTTSLVGQLDDYVLPRLARLDAPMLVVVGGSTGAGKSTLVNSLLRAPVSQAGVLRPTTRSPVLVCNPDDAPWFGEAHLLPDLPRAHAVVDGPRLQVVTAPELPPGLAFLDAPDIDSVVDANRDLAGQLLAAADLWLFLTTAARYADAVPWDVLREARERGAAVALVLDRVPPAGQDVVVEHLRQMLVDHGFGEAPLFVVGEQELDRQGLLPETTVAALREWFATLAGDAGHRAAVIRQTLSGAITALHSRIDAIAVQADAQRDAAANLRVAAQNAYSEAWDRVEEGLRDGALLRGEVLARWHELIGTGELTRALETRVGKVRDQLRAAITGRPLPGRKFQAALTSGIGALITASAGDAAEHTAAHWVNHPAGRALLDSPDDRLRLHRASPDLAERAEQLVADWQRWVLELVRHEAAGKRSVARLTAYTVNATGLLVMIGVFASTAFIPTGAEVAVAGGTTVASQKVLEAIFGDRAVRDLAARARQDLLDRVRVLLDDERQRYTDLLHEAGVDPGAGDRLRTASGEVERARVAAGITPTPDALAAIPLPGEGDEEGDEEEVAAEAEQEAGERPGAASEPESEGERAAEEGGTPEGDPASEGDAPEQGDDASDAGVDAAPDSQEPDPDPETSPEAAPDDAAGSSPDDEPAAEPEGDEEGGGEASGKVKRAKTARRKR